MSLESVLATVDNDVKVWFSKYAALAAKARQAWTLISSPQVRSVLIALGGDAIKVVKDAESAAGSGGLNVALDAQTVTDIRQLIADAKAGDGVLVTDLKILGVSV